MSRKVVLVTGASRGIGAAVATLAAERGYDVAINYVQDRAAAERVARAAGDRGARASTIQADVSVEADVLRLFETVDAQLGRLDALVNNAAMLERQTRLAGVDAARLERVFAVNVTGSFLCAREAV